MIISCVFDLSVPGTIPYENGILKFAIFAGGFLPKDEEAKMFIGQAKPEIKSLHVMGEKDALVPPERSRELMDCFSGPKHEFIHSGAHMVSSQLLYNNIMIDIMDNNLLIIISWIITD